uniref:gamma-butyrobetaine dioxygenase n=1 Tax=Canis lupus familiaris TaxID=9615 RepID=A0A8C0Q552_CANLF
MGREGGKGKWKGKGRGKEERGREKGEVEREGKGEGKTEGGRLKGEGRKGKGEKGEGGREKGEGGRRGKGERRRGKGEVKREGKGEGGKGKGKWKGKGRGKGEGKAEGGRLKGEGGEGGRETEEGGKGEGKVGGGKERGKVEGGHGKGREGGKRKREKKGKDMAKSGCRGQEYGGFAACFRGGNSFFPSFRPFLSFPPSFPSFPPSFPSFTPSFPPSLLPSLPSLPLFPPSLPPSLPSLLPFFPSFPISISLPAPLSPLPSPPPSSLWELLHLQIGTSFLICKPQPCLGAGLPWSCQEQKGSQAVATSHVRCGETAGRSIRDVPVPRRLPLQRTVRIKADVSFPGQVVRGLAPEAHLRTECQYWGAELQLPTLNFEDVLKNDEHAYQWLSSLKKVGIVRLTGASDKRGQVLKLGKRIGFLYLTFYGHTWQVQDKIDANNVAYTTGKLSFHTDYPALHHPPGVQLLHCIKQTVTGGDSEIVDGFNVCQKLKEKNPRAFQILSSTFVDFTDIGVDYCDFSVQSKHKIIELDDKGQVVRINFNNATRDTVFDVPVQRVQPFYAALKEFVDLMNCKEFKFTFKMNPGDVITFDNWRLLHGRRSYEAGTEISRHLEGAYADWDVVMSRLRILRQGVQHRN